MNVGLLLDEGAFLSCAVLTAVAFTALGVWRQAGCAGRSPERRAAATRVTMLMVLGTLLIATSVSAFPREPPLPDALLPDAALPTASYRASNALRQLAINATMVAPFIGWVMWRRQGLAALGIGKDDALMSLAVGACVSLASIPMLGRLSAPFWSTPGTWWMLLAMLGVGASEEVISRGFVLGALAKRLPRPWAEFGSAVLFSLVHVPQRIATGMAPDEIPVSLLILFVFGWCYAFAMRAGKHVPGLAMVHAITNVCVAS